MGLGAGELHLLSLLAEQGHLAVPAAVMEIGAQQLSNSLLAAPEEVSRLGRRLGVTAPLELPPPLETSTAHGELEHQPEAAPPARLLWSWLGFRYAAIDIDGSPDALPLDLNHAAVPRAHRGRYQVVTNFGTTEHVANQLNAFKVIHDLAAPGGVMIHVLPAQGMTCHGLINYNLKFFWMLARDNGYEVLHQDYRADGAAYALPEDILGSVGPEARARLASYRTSDCALAVVLRKRLEAAFAAPTDGPPAPPRRRSFLRAIFGPRR